MPKIDESDLDIGNEPPFVARKVVIKKGQNPKLDYSFSDELGRGRFGTVLKCTEKKSGLKLAAKFVSTRQKEERENVEREVDIMRLLQHRRLLQLYDVYDDGASEMCIITELINGGELFERVIDDDFELTEKVCTIFMRQICEGVQYMHEQFIMHLDMKPENILCVTRTGNRIKLIDFGLARQFDPKKSLQVMFGTPDFAAPEVLSYERVTPAADMWSVGVICYVLLSGLSPFMGNSDLETMTNVTKAIYDFDDESFDPISEEAKDFISKLLIKDPTKRLKPQECLKHKWLETKTKVAKTTQLSKTKLKKYVVRRRWQKAVTAIMALRRMGANLSLTGSLGGGAVKTSSQVGGRTSTSSTSSSRFMSSSSSSSNNNSNYNSSSRTTSSSATTPRSPVISNNRMVINTSTSSSKQSLSSSSSSSSSSKPSSIASNVKFTSSGGARSPTAAATTTSTTKSSFTSTLSPSSKFKTSSMQSTTSSSTSSSYRTTSSSTGSSSSATPRRRY